MSTMTNIFKDPRKNKPLPDVKIMHDPANMAIPEPPVVIERHHEHNPMMYKMPTS